MLKKVCNPPKRYYIYPTSWIKQHNIKMYEAKGENSKKNNTDHIIMDDFNINSLTYD